MSLFKASACITFSSVLLPQTNHRAKLRVKVGELNEIMEMERHDSLEASILTTTALHSIALKELRILRERHISK